MLLFYAVFYLVLIFSCMIFSGIKLSFFKKRYDFKKLHYAYTSIKNLILFLILNIKCFAVKEALLLIFIAPILLLILKANWIDQSSNIIQPEIIGPAHVMETGKAFFEKFIALSAASDGKLTEAELCFRTTCPSGARVSNFVDFYNGQPEGREQRRAWMIENDFTMGLESSFRGRFLHHYSVVTTPYRLMKEGHWEAGITSQYGMAAVLPLFLIAGGKFTNYAVISLAIEVVLIALLAWRLRRGDYHPSVALGACAILLIQALSVNQGAMKISPGFEIYRLLPQIGLGCLFLSKEVMSKLWLVVACLIVALLNSIQFNILFLIVTIGTIGIQMLTYGPKWFAGIKINSLLLAICVGAVIGLQLYLYLHTANAFTPSLFGSTDDGDIVHYDFAATFLGLLIVYFAATAFLWRKEADPLTSGPISVRNKVHELYPEPLVFSFVSYGLFASYCITFYGSPQHFASFVLFSFPAILFIVARIGRLSKVFGMISVLTVATPAIYLSYFTLPQREHTVAKTFYDYVPFGTALRYKAGLDLPAIDQAYTRLLASAGASDAEAYFISKDKIFIEEFRGHTIKPASYDAFANVRTANYESIVRDIKSDSIKYFVLDSNEFVDQLQQYLNFIRPSLMNEKEYSSYSGLLDYINEIRSMDFMKLKSCNSRYCIYDVQLK